jgi:hypothetical protein
MSPPKNSPLGAVALRKGGVGEFRHARADRIVAPPLFFWGNGGGAHQEFRSKKVRANAKITPQNTQ